MTKSAPSLHTDLTDDELRERLTAHERAIAQILAPYDPVASTLTWFDTLRAIEECINLLEVDWAEHERKLLLGLPVLSHPQRLAEARSMLVARFSENFAVRFTQLIMQGSTIAMAFSQHGITHIPPGFCSVGSMTAISCRGGDTSSPCCTRCPYCAVGPARSRLWTR